MPLTDDEKTGYLSIADAINAMQGLQESRGKLQSRIEAIDVEIAKLDASIQVIKGDLEKSANAVKIHA